MASEPVRLSVPKAELSSLRLLAQTNLADLEALAEGLLSQGPTLDLNALAKAVAERGDLDLKLVRSILAILWRLAFVQRKLNRSGNTFLADLKSGLVAAGPDQWTAEDAAAWAAREDRIAQLLASDGVIAYAAKASELLLEQQTVFCKARILTDVRPVFDEQAASIQGFLPFHTLALTLHEGEEMREIHIGMDSADITRLRTQLERAERKESLLRRELSAAGLMVIQTGSESGE